MSIAASREPTNGRARPSGAPPNASSPHDRLAATQTSLTSKKRVTSPWMSRGRVVDLDMKEHVTEHKPFKAPDETRQFPHGHAEIVKAGGGEIGRFAVQPGWRESRDVKPLVKTASCEAPHFQYHVTGHLGIRMDDGTEFVASPGDVTSLPSAHDAWVVCDEPVVVVDWFGASNDAKRALAGVGSRR